MELLYIAAVVAAGIGLAAIVDLVFGLFQIAAVQTDEREQLFSGDDRNG